ncbi:hypothetical protein EI94DRAFT_1703842 [Lactarius quietus]|nr:hypothetical protein EI94DRAFT_1703842 [Lactarius quietus]
MNALLTVASRVEAAVASYNLLARPIANEETWRRCFKEERANVGRHFHVLREENRGIALPLHPTIAALFIILKESCDLSDIGRNYPGVMWHSYYELQAKFPEEISHLLQSSGEFWWEALAAKAQLAAPRRPLPRIRLLPPTQPLVP